MRLLLNSSIPEKSRNIEEFISAGKNAPLLSYYNYSILQVEYSKDNKIQVEFTADILITDYLDVFQDMSQQVYLTREERNKYYYNPDLLSYDLYGTIELDFIIMILNGVIDPKEFSMPVLHLIQKTQLIQLLSQIYNAEMDYISINRNKYNLKLPI